MISTGDHAARAELFRQALGAMGLDGALLVHATDVFYFTGTRQNAALWLPVRGSPVLLVRKSLARAEEESAVEVRRFPRSKDLPGVLAGARRVGFTFDAVPISVERLYQRLLPGIELFDVSLALRKQRSVKSPDELDRMRETAALLCGVFAEVPSFLRAGMLELELAAEIEYRMRRAGNEGTPRLRGFNLELFIGLTTAGASASAPGFFDGPVTGRGLSAASPIGPSRSVIGPDAAIVLDYTAVSSGYVIDMTRMAVCGKLAPELDRAFLVARRIQDEVTRGLVPGAVPSRLWEAALELARSEGLEESFMGAPGERASFVGHGLGLELDELPVLAPGFDDPLVAGQTVAVEPKFVFPGLGAAGIENTWAVRPGGGEQLTRFSDELLRPG